MSVCVSSLFLVTLCSLENCHALYFPPFTESKQSSSQVCPQLFFISDFTADPKLVSNWPEFIFKDRPLRAGTAAEESARSKPGDSASGNREDSPDHAPWICPQGETENVRPTMMSWGLREKIQRHQQNCSGDVTSRWKRFYHTKDLFPAISSTSWRLKLTWRNIKYLQTKGGHFYGSVLTTLFLHLIHK